MARLLLACLIYFPAVTYAFEACQDITGIFLIDAQRSIYTGLIQTDCEHLYSFSAIQDHYPMCTDRFCNVQLNGGLLDSSDEKTSLDLSGFHRDGYWMCGDASTSERCPQTQSIQLNADGNLHAIKTWFLNGKVWYQTDEIWKHVSYIDAVTPRLQILRDSSGITPIVAGGSKLNPIMNPKVNSYLMSLAPGKYECDSSLYFDHQSNPSLKVTVLIPQVTACFPIK